MDNAAQQPKYKTGPAMKLPLDAKPAPARPVETPPAPQTQSEEIKAKAVPNGWHGMENAPRDGTLVYLHGDDCDEKEVPNEWYWHATRQFRKGTWQVTGWWRLRFGANCPPSFSPTGWRTVKEGLPPK